MGYPGNNSLVAEVKERILTTFEQTLDLAARGELGEASTGCDFILRLDPTFRPAAQLKQRLEQGEGALLVDDLRLAEKPAKEPTASGDVFEVTKRDGASGPPETDGGPPAAKENLESLFSDVEAREVEAALDLEGPPTPGSSELMSSGEPLAALDSESEQRIQELLDEGQTAFGEGRYQSAIDAWSRIFLVDIDHQEASRRIELARKLKAEVERQVEELYHEGVSRVESGDFDGARENFTKVLEMEGSHLAAQEYLDKLEAGTLGTRQEGVATEAAEEPAAGTPQIPQIPRELTEPVGEIDALPDDALGMPDEVADSPETTAEIEPPPPPTPSKPRGIKRSFLYIGGGVLALAVTAGWFLYRNFDDTFPNAGQEAPPVAGPQVDVIARAQQVFDEGNTELAIAQLKRLPPNHPRYAEAQALIAQWETPETDPGEEQLASPEQLAERDALVEQARAAFDNRQFLRSHRLLTQAAAVTTLEDEGLQLQTAAALELQPLRSEIEIFRQGDWAQALRSLWQIRQNDPDNPDVRQLMVDSYYNLGVRDLQRRDPAAAATSLKEALDLAGGDDPELERTLRFAESYQNRPVDLLYRIFVKYLPFR